MSYDGIMKGRKKTAKKNEVKRKVQKTNASKTRAMSSLEKTAQRKRRASAIKQTGSAIKKGNRTSAISPKSPRGRTINTKKPPTRGK